MQERSHSVIAYHAKELDSSDPRAHPWTVGKEDESHRYIDFKSEPHLIRTALEDWAPFSAEPFAETFFQLLEWLNGHDSNVESNDCAFRPAGNNRDKQFQYSMRCDGRLMILFRDLFKNTQTSKVDWLLNEGMQALEEIDQGFVAGAVGFSFSKTAYMAFGKHPKQGAAGHQVMLSFYAYGNDGPAAHDSMNRLLKNVHSALRKIDARTVAET